MKILQRFFCTKVQKEVQLAKRKNVFCLQTYVFLTKRNVLQVLFKNFWEWCMAREPFRAVFRRAEKRHFCGFVSCCFSGGPKRRKIQGIYFEISALYFKIYGLYFLQQAMCFFACPQTREKTRGRVGALSVNTWKISRTALHRLRYEGISVSCGYY